MKANAFGRVPPPLPDVFVCCYETHSSTLPHVKTVSEFKVCQPRRAFCFLSQRVLTEGNLQSENPQTTAHNKHVSMETSSSDGCFYGLFSWLNSLWFKVFQAVKVTLMFLWRNTTIKLPSFVSETSDFSLLVSPHPENIPDDLFVGFTGILNHCRISLHLHLLKNRFPFLSAMGKQVQETLIWIWCFLTSSSLTVWRNDTNTMDLLTQIQPQSQDGTNRLKRASVKGKLVCFQLQKLSWSCEYTTNLHLLSSLPTETLRKANRWIWSS